MWRFCKRCGKASSLQPTDWWGRCPRCGDWPTTSTTDPRRTDAATTNGAHDEQD